MKTPRDADEWITIITLILGIGCAVFGLFFGAPT